MKAFAIKTFAIIFSIIALVSAGVLGFAYYWYTSNTNPVSAQEAYTRYEVKSGATFNEVASELEEMGIIRNGTAFRVWSILSGEEVVLQAGEHRLSPHMTLKQITEELSVSMTEDARILIKEGMRLEEIAEILDEKLDDSFNKNEFLSLAKPYEGMLFPDTYNMYTNTTPQKALETLNQQFERKYRELNGPANPEEKKRIVILASMLEREGKTDQDRPVIAGILNNRLTKQTEAAGLLQVDATVQYALNETRLNTNTWWPSPRPQDLQIESVYNTYKNPGLPPAPICNPGVSALKAAINPQENNYVYYIHDNSGQAYYARTLVEHNQNIARYLR
jgi:UPF0755 protein